MAGRGFFTPEMGKRLRSIRIGAHLTQDEVANRMGLTGSRREVEVWRLEQGRSVNPTLERIALYLRACGARWSDFTSLLERIDTPQVDTPAIERSGFALSDRERLAAATLRQAYRFEQGLRFTSGEKPVHPERRTAVAAKLRNYRIAANIIEQAVEDELRQAELSPVSYPIYKAVARQCLGFLWRDMRRPARRAARGTPDERLATKLAMKEDDWRRQKLDLALLKRVQQVVIERFRRLCEESPELFEARP